VVGRNANKRDPELSTVLSLTLILLLISSQISKSSSTVVNGTSPRVSPTEEDIFFMDLLVPVKLPSSKLSQLLLTSTSAILTSLVETWMMMV
jgi:hypothetical protein